MLDLFEKNNQNLNKLESFRDFENQFLENKDEKNEKNEKKSNDLFLVQKSNKKNI